MSIFTYLKKDHKLVKELIEQISSLDAQENEKRHQLFEHLKREILVHSKAEEKVFYEPLEKEKGTKDEIHHAEEEHAEVEDMLERLSDKKLHGDAWMQLFKKMSDSLLHHIEEEEHEIFADAKKELSSEEAQQMEWAMQKAKKAEEKKLDR